MPKRTWKQRLARLKRKLSQWKASLARTCRYLYFLRFSIFLLVFSLGLAILNESPLRALTSGIVTPERSAQYLCVIFFVTTAGFVSLIMARVVVVNGRDRFDTCPPRWMKKLLADDDAKREWCPVAVFQIPTVFVVLYMLWNGSTVLWGHGELLGGTSETATWVGVLLGSIGGMVLAGILWWVINAGFYMAYEMPSHDGQTTVQLGVTAARTILFPRSAFRLQKPGETISDLTLEAVTIAPLNAWRKWRMRKRKEREPAGKKAAGDGVANPTVEMRIIKCEVDEKPPAVPPKLPGVAGYSYKDGHLFEAHSFSIVAVASFLALYFVLWPMTAPVKREFVSWVFFSILMAIPGLIAIYLLVKKSSLKQPASWNSDPKLAQKEREDLKKARGRFAAFQAWASVVIAVFLGSVGTLYHLKDAARFPIFALLLILITLVSWGFGGLAFFVDRYRIPVLTVILFGLIGLRLVPGWIANKWLVPEEHYLSTAKSQVSDPSSILTPERIVQIKQDEHPDDPLIIVTATGGGLHASAWTATVLSVLEDTPLTDKQGKSTTFHDNLLLASTVSGGSLGLMNYLNELQPPERSKDAAWQTEGEVSKKRVVSGAECSSLESIGWGLIYYDLPRVAMPIRLPHWLHFWTAPSTGESDLDDGETPLGKDRTWALRKGFIRNLRDKWCGTAKMPNDRRPDNAPLTLEKLLADGSGNKPAFTMNSTTVEGGKRFLVANYDVPRVPLGLNESCPSQSFLGAYGPPRTDTPEELKSNCNVLPVAEPADLYLATAAQMSATFPYVSSAARIPESVNKKGLHFIDGGNYDNDGTASAIEFIRSALRNRMAALNAQDAAKKKGQVEGAGKQPSPLKIILIEIRNSADNNDDRPQPCSVRWSIFGQATAPVTGFLAAGHDSVTERNRVGLDLLEKSFPPDMLQIHRIVFADFSAFTTVGTDPLNWSLTPAQRKEVEQSGDPSRLAKPGDNEDANGKQRKEALEHLIAKYREAVDWYHDFDGKWTPNPEREEIPNQGPCDGDSM